MYKFFLVTSWICIFYIPTVLSIAFTSTCYGCSFINSLGLDKRSKERFRQILKDRTLSKRELEEQIEDLIRTQSSRIKEKFRNMRNLQEEKDEERRRKIIEAAQKLSPEARTAVHRMLAIASNKELTLDESKDIVDDIRNALPPEIRKEIENGLKGIILSHSSHFASGVKGPLNNNNRGSSSGQVQGNAVPGGTGCKKCGGKALVLFLNDGIDGSGESLITN